MSAARTSLFAKLFRRTPTTIRTRKPAAPVRLGLTALEAREVPAAFATLDPFEGVLRVVGSDAADEIEIVRTGGQVSVTGTTIRLLPAGRTRSG